MAQGTGLTDTQAAQLTALYNQLVYNKKLGDIITVSLSGSHTNSNYQMQICYLTSTKIYLLGYSNLGNAAWNTQINYTWTVTIAAGKLTTNAITITGVKIPTLENINTTTANYKRDFSYWTSTRYDSSNAWCVYSADQRVYYPAKTNSFGSIPYVTINL